MWGWGLNVRLMSNVRLRSWMWGWSLNVRLNVRLKSECEAECEAEVWMWGWSLNMRLRSKCEVEVWMWGWCLMWGWNLNVRPRSECEAEVWMWGWELRQIASWDRTCWRMYRKSPLHKQQRTIVDNYFMAYMTRSQICNQECMSASTS